MNLSKAFIRTINESVAKKMGYTYEDSEEETSAFDPAGTWGGSCYTCRCRFWYPPGKQENIEEDAFVDDLPDFATSRDALVPAWEMLSKDNELWSNFFQALEIVFWQHTQRFLQTEMMHYVWYVQCEAIFCCIAALGACGYWTDELEAAWKKENYGRIGDSSTVVRS